MKLRVLSQIWDAEAKKGILDDCGYASLGAAVAWASGYTFTPTVGEVLVAAKKAIGYVDRQGAGDAGSSLPGLAKTAVVLGAKARYAKSWADVLAAGKAGNAIGIWVQQPVGYPKAVAMSAWHKKWAKRNAGKPDASYGHMTCAAFDPAEGWMWADPTRTGKGAEAFAVPITEADLFAIADSKRVSGKHNAPAHKHVLIITYPKAATPEAVVPPKAEKADPAPFPAPVVEPIVIAPVVPTPAPVVPSKPVPVAPVQAKWTGLRGQLTWVVGRLTGRNIAK
jgi:hypothetical protein